MGGACPPRAYIRAFFGSLQQNRPSMACRAAACPQRACSKAIFGSLQQNRPSVACSKTCPPRAYTRPFFVAGHPAVTASGFGIGPAITVDWLCVHQLALQIFRGKLIFHQKRFFHRELLSFYIWNTHRQVSCMLNPTNSSCNISS